MEISGKKVVVIGGASGFGRASAELLASKGAKVAVLDREGTDGKDVANAIGGTFRPVDVTDFAGTVSDADRARFAAAARGPVRSESTYIATHVAQRREMRLPSLYAAEADALVRAAQWRAFFEAGPRMFRVTTDRYLGQVEVGDLGALAYPQYDLDRGVGVVVLGYQEALAGRRLTLTVVTVPWVTDPPAAEAGVFFVLDEDLLA